MHVRAKQIQLGDHSSSNCQDLKHCPIPPHSLGTLFSSTSFFTTTHIHAEEPELCSSFLCLPLCLYCEFWRAMRPFRHSTWWVSAPLRSDYYDYILHLNSWSPVTYFQLRTRECMLLHWVLHSDSKTCFLVVLSKLNVLKRHPRISA